MLGLKEGNIKYMQTAGALNDSQSRPLSESGQHPALPFFVN